MTPWLPIAGSAPSPTRPMEERTSTQQHRPTGKYKQSMVRGFLHILRDLDPHVVPCFKHGVTMDHILWARYTSLSLSRLLPSEFATMLTYLCS